MGGEVKEVGGAGGSKREARGNSVSPLGGFIFIITHLLLPQIFFDFFFLLLFLLLPTGSIKHFFFFFRFLKHKVLWDSK